MMIQDSIGLQEIVNKRTYNQKVYLIDNQHQIYDIHTSHIHYKEGSKFKDIDTTLSFDENSRTYKQNKSSYHSSFPEYSDEWFDFYNVYEGANHLIRARPLCNHIKGQIYNHDGEHYVIYPAAFGDDIDLIVYAQRQGVKKIIRINKKPKDDKLSFKFELELPSDKNVKEIGKNSWTKSDILDFSGKILLIGDVGKESYFRDARVWDSGMINQSVKIMLENVNSVIFLTKTITKDIIDSAVYPLFTDHLTDYYTGAGDGTVYKSASNYPDTTTWDMIHDATSGSASYTSTITSGIATQNYSTTNFVLYRAFYPVLTSGISDTATIDSAALHYPVSSKTNTDNDGNDFAVIVQTNQASPTSLTAADFNNCGTVDSPTEGSERVDFGAITASAYNTINLDATGISWISKTGYTYLGMREGHDVVDSVVDTNTGNVLTVYWSESVNDPHLLVTVTDTIGIKSVAGVLYADIKKISGADIALIEKVGGVAR